MAYSILNTPGEYFSLNDDLIFTIKDDVKPYDAVTYPDYKYVCDIYIDGSLIVRLKSIPHPDTKIGIFTISNILRNYVVPVFDPRFSGMRANQSGVGEFYQSAQLKFGEEYGFTIYTNIAIDSERTYFNHYNGRLASVRTILPSKLDKVLSNRPFATPIYRSSVNNFIPFLPTDDTQIEVKVRSYFKNGTLVNTLTQPYYPPATSTNVQQLFNVSPYRINEVSPGFINEAIDYYTVEFSTTNIIDDSIYRFDLICEPKYEVFSIHFMNQYGGFETKNFTKVSRKSIEIERTGFESLNYTIDPNTGIIGYHNASTAFSETKINYATLFTEKLILNTDILSDQEYVWLRDLVLSPKIFIEFPGPIYYPILIKETNYELRKTINDDLTNLTLTFEFDEKFNTQYR